MPKRLVIAKVNGIPMICGRMASEGLEANRLKSVIQGADQHGAREQYSR